MTPYAIKPIRRRVLLALAGSTAGLPSASHAQPSEREALQGASRLVAGALAGELDRQWDRLRTVGAAVERGQAAQGAAELRRLMDAAQRDAPHTIWIGVANARDGKVIAASGGIIEGWDVSERPWFQAARTRNFAGDVHSAVLLERALNRNPRDEPLRLIDFAMPVRNASGAVVGVLGSHVDWRWVVQIIANAPTPPGTTVAIVSQSWQVLFGPDGSWAADVARYPIALVQQRADAPGLGWRVVGLPSALLRGQPTGR